VKHFLSVATAALAVLLVPRLAEAQQFRIGYINSDRIVAESPAFADVRQTMERELGPLRDEVQRLESELQTANEQLQAQAPLLTEQVRQQRQQALQQQFQRYQERRQQIQQQVGAREQELLAPVMERMRAVLEDVRRAGNYTFIIDPPDGLVVAVDPAVDVTEEVLRRLAEGGAGSGSSGGSVPRR
jgi:outer membrane protein